MKYRDYDLHQEKLIQPHQNGIKLCKPNEIVDDSMTIKDIFNMPLNVYFTNHESKILSLNDSTAKLTGFSSTNAAIGNTIERVTNRVTASISLEHDKRVRKHGEMKIVEEHFSRLDDISYPALSIKFPWYNSENKIIGAFGFSIVMGEYAEASLAESLMHIFNTGLFVKKNHLQSINNILPGHELDGVYLSKREIDCLQHLIQGKTTKMTAKILRLSPRTVEYYLENIKAKLGVNSKAELIHKVMRKVLV
ncbi:LuxR family transcriptional regulator [Legionella gratiana]|uniref:LuxR family transcriptional regulator n=1 Tax=Legionella gratiana TaxID=45066 RepID=A0A378JHS8_9GAMM|nr:LuxR C-terminal-related transcriptional regulator [Legionella gratiana]KTD11917.1 LuxR family transcriptional regulator [Legionella gratiana]STX46478.1 LuxR family transcriptional regulator [Legionella gratiana]